MQNRVCCSCDQAGEYRCKVSQVADDGNVNSVYLLTRPILVSVCRTPVVIRQQPPAFLEIKEGEELRIDCLAQSHPEPHYQWFRDNTKLKGETSNVLRVSVRTPGG